MKTIIIVIICAGMLLIGGAGNAKGSSFNKTAMLEQSPSSAVTCTIQPCSLDDIITNRVLSVSLHGVEANHELASLQGDLCSLKAELTTLQKGTIEYNEKVAELHNTLGKISVLLGEINSLIDTEMQTLFEISQRNTNKIEADLEVREILYEAETE